MNIVYLIEHLTQKGCKYYRTNNVQKFKPRIWRMQLSQPIREHKQELSLKREFLRVYVRACHEEGSLISIGSFISEHSWSMIREDGVVTNQILSCEVYSCILCQRTNIFKHGQYSYRINAFIQYGRFYLLLGNSW